MTIQTIDHYSVTARGICLIEYVRFAGERSPGIQMAGETERVVGKSHSFAGVMLAAAGLYI